MISQDLIKVVAKNLNNMEPKHDASGKEFFKNKVVYSHNA